MRTKSALSAPATIAIGALAGFAGGLAEIGWIIVYAVLSDSNAELVARGVTDAVGLSGATAAPVTAGIVIHMILAGILGIAIAFGLRSIAMHLRGAFGVYAIAVIALVAVWAANFFALLPQISPQFVQMVPYGVTLASKLLFGIAAASVLQLRLPAQPASLQT